MEKVLSNSPDNNRYNEIKTHIISLTAKVMYNTQEAKYQ